MGAIGAGSCVPENGVRSRDIHRSKVCAIEAELTGRNYEPDPLTAGGQRAHISPAGGAGGAVKDLVDAPEGAVFPRSVIPLQHDFGGRVGWIEINVSDQVVATVHGECRRGA